MTKSCLILGIIAFALAGGCAPLPAETNSMDTSTEGPSSNEDAIANHQNGPRDEVSPEEKASSSDHSIATLGAGCYWCVEAVLEQLEGVHAVRSGFMGGHVDNPSYDAVCRGETGHAEVVEVRFDPAVISYDEILAWFWQLHDPTTLNRQGNDVGTQYRSAIYFHSEEQRIAAEESKRKADATGVFSGPIVTEITAASTFYEAKAEHQDFYRNNKSQGYCHYVISPKLKKLGLKQ